jgi:hypothetical protein
MLTLINHTRCGGTGNRLSHVSEGIRCLNKIDNVYSLRVASHVPTDCVYDRLGGWMAHCETPLREAGSQRRLQLQTS